MSKNGFYKLRLSLIGVLVAAEMVLGIAQSALAQIIEDDTLGSERSVIIPEVEIQGIPSDRIDGGAVRGPNLFHSFEQFNIEAGRGAYFSNPDGVDNILNRVTGNDPSNLFGTLGVLGPANLFFLNPNGILFGPEARLDLQGSFLAATADSFVFPNGDAFSALNPQPPSLLTVSAPLGLQYGPQPSGMISAQGSELSLESSRSLVLAGGTINLDNSILTVAGGHIELGAAAGAGTVGLDVNGDRLSLDFPDAIERADVSLAHESELDVTAEDGGDIAITAQDLDILAGSGLIAGTASGLGAEGNQAGDITLNATGTIDIGQFSFIRNTVFPDAISSSGNINITAETLLVTGGSQLDAGASGEGNAGNVIINAADQVIFDNSFAFSNVEEEAMGDGGNIEINARSLELLNGSELQVQTAGRGNAGNVVINATDQVVFAGVSADGPFPGAAFSDVEAGAVGNGGDIEITTGTLSLTDALLLAEASGQGNAGNVTINVAGELRAVDSNILTTAAQSSGGAINITARDIRLFGDSNIRTNVFSGAGKGGDITLTADTIFAFDDSDILAFAQDGRGGNITLNTPAFFGENFRPNLTITDPEELDGNDRVDINASGAVSGMINLPDVTFLETDLVELPERFIIPETLAASSCVARSQTQTGRFIITGSDSLPERPGETAILPYSTGTIRSLPVEESLDNEHALPWERGEPIVESQGAYLLTDGRLILSRECV